MGIPNSWGESRPTAKDDATTHVPSLTPNKRHQHEGQQQTRVAGGSSDPLALVPSSSGYRGKRNSLPYFSPSTANHLQSIFYFRVSGSGLIFNLI